MFATLALIGLLAGGTGHDATVHHGFGDVDHWVSVFDDPSRDAWQKPDAILDALHVRAGMTVADLGAGTGYFSVRLAKAVGESGRVLAIDVEPKLVDYLKERAARESLPQITAVLAAPSDPKLPPSGVSLVMIVDTWHHIDDRLTYLKTLAKGIAPGGRVAVVDFKKGDFPVGPPDAHKLAPEQVIQEFSKAGWALAERKDDLPYQYVLSFSPPRP
ncbi:MAG TPA: methyltransferase domain-containing protein [Candidatus Polarisedimenticolaceae bacterium]|nr:methyltransferase domain-containing protein [Candidatus Polarisedimenticolaceae bacterium]